MKKLVLLFSVIVFTLSSCSNDDDSNSNNDDSNSQVSILGKWYIKGGTIDNGDFIQYDNDCSTNRDFQEFFNNGELVFNGYNSSCELNEVETSNWVQNGNTLTVSNTNFDPMIYQYEYTIEKLDENELILKQSVNEPDGTFDYRTTLTRN